MPTPDLRTILDFAVEIAWEAGRLTLGYFNNAPAVELKADRSPVSIADRGAEELLRRRIRQAFPRHGIVGEEFGITPGDEPARWILDPIDGTQSFICGVPLYSVLVGFEWEGRMLAGVIHMPALRETAYAARELGAWWDGRPARVSNVASLADARLVITSPKCFERHAAGEHYRRLRDACRIERGWSDAYGYLLLATGRCDVIADPMMEIWDNAPLLPIITEAGGKFTDWDGAETHTNPTALATNGALHSEALQVLHGR